MHGRVFNVSAFTCLCAVMIKCTAVLTVLTWCTFLKEETLCFTVLFVVLQVNELVQVETYLRSEGVLVRYWYPIDMLERPPAGYRRTATNGLVTLDNTNIQIHR